MEGCGAAVAAGIAKGGATDKSIGKQTEDGEASLEMGGGWAGSGFRRGRNLEPAPFQFIGLNQLSGHHQLVVHSGREGLF